MAWHELAAVLPDLATERVARWVGDCRVHAVRAVPAQRRWSLLSSRLPKALDEHPEWFQRLRAACEDARGRGGLLIAVEGTAACRFVLHAARRFQLPTLYLRLPTEPRSAPDDHVLELCVRFETAPAIEDKPASVATDPTLQTVPLRDRLLWLLGQEIGVLAARRGGSVERLIACQQRETPDWQPMRLDGPLLTAPSLTAPSLTAPSFTAPLATAPLATAPLVEGAPAGSTASHELRSPATEPASSAAASSAAMWPQASGFAGGTRLPWPALWHSTRRHEGPWAGQTADEFLDELLFERPERDRSALATLRRILSERRLRASSMAIRGGAAAVCFSAAPLHERPSMRVFRAHRGRWDAEPFGIAIRAELLAARGARPVIYGDETVWERLPEPERPWFQRRTTRAGKTPIDWSLEQEWRLPSDLWLDELPADEVRVFVPDEATAKRIAGECPWPVMTLNDAT